MSCKARLATERECTACMACVSVCKHEALTRILKKDGHVYVDFNVELCVECGLCEKVCPIATKQKYGTDRFVATKPYKGWSNIEEYRQRGTSGGVFGALAYDFINSGGVVVGAELKDNKCKYVAIERIEDIARLQGSKYILSDAAGIHNEIRNYLKDGRKVLFTGLPCHVAGVISLFANSPLREELYTVDLVCGGIPSSLLMESFLKTHKCYTIQTFRDKAQYKLTAKDANGIEHDLGDHNPMLSGFSNGLSNRWSCYDCKCAYPHRISDVTIADYWTTEKGIDYKAGVSLILVIQTKENF